ncbi:MAG: hypothetical protein ACRDJH_27200 [Thermomicrobiales bacterium]
MAPSWRRETTAMTGSGLTNRLRQRSRRAGLAVGLSMALTIGLSLGSFIVIYARLEPFTRDFVGADIPAPAGAASGYARITLRTAECPAAAGPVGRCDGDRLPGVEFLVAGALRRTDEAGEASWAPGAGAHQIVTRRTSLAASYVSCTDQIDGDNLFEGIAPDPTRVAITTTAGQPVVCEWYFHLAPVQT